MSGKEENIYTGKRYVKFLTSATMTGDGLAIVQGLPPCPECGRTLSHLYLQGLWHCSGCDTQWDESSLIAALQNERAVAKYKEETLE